MRLKIFYAVLAGTLAVVVVSHIFGAQRATGVNVGRDARRDVSLAEAFVADKAQHSAEVALLRGYLDLVRADVEAAHAKIDRLHWQLKVVVNTCPGRARPPQLATPPPVRPVYPEAEE